jgi:enoyl-CoA hydratase/carnithine racemase
VNSEPLLLADTFDRGRGAMLTLNRPQVHNALSTSLAKAILGELERLDEQPSLRCVILTGSGTRAFCAGADLKERAGMTADAWRAQHAVFEAVFTRIRRFPKPFIAAVNGVAAGGGFELALNADFIIASTTARFGSPEVRVGIIPGGAAPQLLHRAVPVGLARQMLMTGELIDASCAHAAGLVNSLHEPDQLRAAALELAQRISGNSPAAVRAVKEALAGSLGKPPEDAIIRGLELYNTLVDTPDRYEGVTAFNEGRPPDFAD